MKHYTKEQFKAIAADLFRKPTAKKQAVYKPSQNLLKVRAAATALLAKMKEAVKAPKARKANFLKKYSASMAVSPSDLKSITQKELQGLTDAELNLLKRQIDAAQKQRIYNKVITNG